MAQGINARSKKPVQGNTTYTGPKLVQYGTHVVQQEVLGVSTLL